MKSYLVVAMLAGIFVVTLTAQAIDTVPLPEKPASPRSGTQAIGTWPTPEKPATKKRLRPRRCTGPRCPRRMRTTRTRPRPAPRR